MLLQDPNKYALRYTHSELNSFQGGPISLEEAKKKYPNAKICDLCSENTGNFTRSKFTGKANADEVWDEILYVIDEYVIAYVNQNYYRFAPSNFLTLPNAFFTYFWYASEVNPTPVSEQHPKDFINTINRFLQKLSKTAENIRSLLMAVYPKKTCSYTLDHPLTQMEYSYIKRCLTFLISKVETEPLYNERKKIEKIQVKINIKSSGDELREHLLGNLIRFRKDNPDSSKPVPADYFANLPENAKVEQNIPLTVLQKKFPKKYDLLFTLFFYVKSIKWLYKFSETTTSLPGNSGVDEIHILLIDLKDVIRNRTNRVIRDRNYRFQYIYDVEFATESKFLSYLDLIIPYQTFCIFRIDNEKPIYQIWSGKKSITMKGSKVKKYVHTDWMYEEELVRKPLEFNGKSLSEVFSNFIS